MGDKRTVTIEAEAAARLAELAVLSGRSEDWFANFMICEYAERELKLVRELKARMNSAAAGNVVSHEDATAQFRATIARAGASVGRSAAE